MSNNSIPPQSRPGDILNWPLLKIRYLSSAEAIAKLLPPGIAPGLQPGVTVTIYNFPVLNEPEYGYVINVDARYQAIEGEYTLAIGIDQEAAIYGSQERWGQPKFYATTQYFRLMDNVQATLSHSGYTFLKFNGKVTESVERSGETETNEFWIKSLRSVDASTQRYDFPPHVVKVYSKFGTAYLEKVEGELTLLESPWDPIAARLPIIEEPTAELWTPIFLDRQITLEGELNGDAFWPFTNRIGGSRWPA